MSPDATDPVDSSTQVGIGSGADPIAGAYIATSSRQAPLVSGSPGKRAIEEEDLAKRKWMTFIRTVGVIFAGILGVVVAVVLAWR